MPHSVITRKTISTVKRSQVKAGDVFRASLKKGLGERLYAALGHNGKYFSLNLSSGEVASSQNGDKDVSVVGKFHIKTTLNPTGTKMRRSEVPSDGIFQVKDGGENYLNLGRLANGRYISLNMAKPFSDDYSVGDDKNVTLIGSWAAEAEVVA